MTNPFAALDKVKANISLNEEYDKEIRAIQDRRFIVQSWKNERNKIKKLNDKKKNRGRDY